MALSGSEVAKHDNIESCWVIVHVSCDVSSRFLPAEGGVCEDCTRRYVILSCLARYLVADSTV